MLLLRWCAQIAKNRFEVDHTASRSPDLFFPACISVCNLYLAYLFSVHVFVSDFHHSTLRGSIVVPFIDCFICDVPLLLLGDKQKWHKHYQGRLPPFTVI